MKNQIKIINAQRRMILLSIVIFFLALATPLISANSYEFVLHVKGTNMSWEWDYYNHGGVEIPLINTWFTSFSAEFLEVTEVNYSEPIREADESWSDIELEDGRQNYIGRYEFEIQLLDSSKDIINETKASSDFYLFSEPPVELEEDVLFFSFEKKNNAKYIRVLYNDSVILEQEFKSLLCNSNGKCENSYSESYRIYNITGDSSAPDAEGEYFFYQMHGNYPAYYNTKGYYLYWDYIHKIWLMDRVIGNFDGEFSGGAGDPNSPVGPFYDVADMRFTCFEVNTNITGMQSFENYLSCASDCGYFALDGTCNKADTSPYTFNDYCCDFDCLNDAEENGECFRENCNDGVMNQDETSVDKGGVCTFEIPRQSKGFWAKLLGFFGIGE